MDPAKEENKVKDNIKINKDRVDKFRLLILIQVYEEEKKDFMEE